MPVIAQTYIDLVNKLRDRFNEPRLTTANWNSVVGFDQFTKDAINYAYHDILNAEVEWPFLHQPGLVTTTPGVQFYTFLPPAYLTADDGSTLLTGIGAPLFGGTSSPLGIKTIDWDSFFVYGNENTFTILNETHTIPTKAPFTIVTNAVLNTWASDLGVTDTSGPPPIAYTPVSGEPFSYQYTIRNGTYVFSPLNAGNIVNISYTYITQNTGNPPLIMSSYLPYMDYDDWRMRYLINDFNTIAEDYTKPTMVFRTNRLGEIGFSPVPDQVYNVGFEYWLDCLDLAGPTDIPLIPRRFWQTIIDGAQKYCFEFREDAQLAQSAEMRFEKGIYRMRIELINRDNTMDTGTYWYPHGISYTWPSP